MKAIIFLALSSALLLSIAKAEGPAVKFTANPNSFKVGTPFNVKCHVENVAQKNDMSLIISYMFKPTDQAEVALGSWAFVFITSLFCKIFFTIF